MILDKIIKPLKELDEEIHRLYTIHSKSVEEKTGKDKYEQAKKITRNGLISGILATISFPFYASAPFLNYILHSNINNIRNYDSSVEKDGLKDLKTEIARNKERVIRPPSFIIFLGFC